MSQTLGIVTAGAQFALESILIKPKRGFFTKPAAGNNPSAYIAPVSITMQVVIEESHADELEITDHPVETGAMISDHAFKRPPEVTIKCGWSNSPSQAGLIDGLVGGLKSTVTGVQNLIGKKEAQNARDVYDKLLALQAAVTPFDILTGKRKYTNMLIRSLSVTTDKSSENSLMATIVCRHVIIVSTRVVAVPADASRQQTPSSTAAPVDQGTKSLIPTSAYSNAGAGRGFINPPLVTP